MKLSQLAERVNGDLLGKDCLFEKISTDTRHLEPGDAFLALRGKNFDGHNYALQALEKGACAVIVEKACGSESASQLIVNDACKTLGQAGAIKREQFFAPVIAITGSSGKTTVKGMLSSILSCHGRVLATRGNFNNHIGVPLTLLGLAADYQYAVVEAGTSGSGEIAYLSDLIQPEVALVNNVMPAHMEGFGSEQRIAEEKSALYTGNRLHTGVVNLQDKFATLFMDKLSTKDIMGYALACDEVELRSCRQLMVPPVTASVIALLGNKDACSRYSFTLLSGERFMAGSLNVPGVHNVKNAVAAAACALAVNISLETIVAGLAAFKGDNGRMQLKPSDRCRVLVDDSYNANPGSMKAAISYLSDFSSAVLIAGDMAELGASAEAEHFAVGQYARRSGIRKVFAVGNLSAALAKGFGDGAHWFEDQPCLLESLKGQDLRSSEVLVKGSRSSKMENIVRQLQKSEGESSC